MSSVLFVWKPTETHSLGHASMVIDLYNKREKTYVSWYPKTDPASAVYFGDHDEDWETGGKFISSIKEEIESVQGRYPDLSVKLDGLNPDEMRKSWNRVKKHGVWSLQKFNCSAILYTLLRRGGAPGNSKVRRYKKIIENREKWLIGAGATYNILGFQTGNVLWTQDTPREDIIRVLGQIADGTWTPIRIYNYAIVLHQMQRLAKRQKETKLKTRRSKSRQRRQKQARP